MSQLPALVSPVFDPSAPSAPSRASSPPPAAASGKRWLGGLSVGQKLGLAFGLLGLAVAALGATTWYTGQATSAKASRLIDEQLPIERSVRNWRTSSVRLGEMALRTTTSTDVFPLLEQIRAHVKTEEELVQSIAQQVAAASTRETTTRTLNAVVDQRVVYVRLRDALVQNALEGKIISQKEMADHAQALKEYLARIDDMLALSERSATEAANAMMADARRAQWISGIAVTLVIALAALFGWLLRRSIVTPLAQASQVVSQVAAGDLTVRVNADRADEIGQMMTAVNRMVESLHYVVTEVRDSAESIHVASSEVATGNMDLSMRTEQAASNLEETSASVEQLTGMVLANAGNTRQANDLVNQATRVASRGGEVVKQVVETMNDINSSSQRIVEIVSIIDGIAFQTNILALNAAVEAARAGEQGRGFAVVASEVRSLASRSANAAKEINQLISASVEKVSNGAKLVVTAGTTMDEIVGSVEKIQSIMTEVSEATHQQSAEIGQVGQAISLLDQMTQQNAALVEEGAAAAQSLQEQATRLNSAMSSFRLHAGAHHAG